MSGFRVVSLEMSQKDNIPHLIQFECGLIGQDINDDVLKRTVKIQGQRGASLVSVIQLMNSLGITEDDVDAIRSNLPGFLAYDVPFQNQAKLTDFLSSHTPNDFTY